MHTRISNKLFLLNTFLTELAMQPNTEVGRERNWSKVNGSLTLLISIYNQIMLKPPKKPDILLLIYNNYQTNSVVSIPHSTYINITSVLSEWINTNVLSSISSVPGVFWQQGSLYYVYIRNICLLWLFIYQSDIVCKLGMFGDMTSVNFCCTDIWIIFLGPTQLW